jgi:hypothetical protein
MAARVDVHVDVGAERCDIHLSGPAVGDVARTVEYSQGTAVLRGLADVAGRPLVVMTSDGHGRRYRDVIIPPGYSLTEHPLDATIRVPDGEVMDEPSHELVEIGDSPAADWWRLFRPRRPSLVVISVVVAVCVVGVSVGLASAPISRDAALTRWSHSEPTVPVFTEPDVGLSALVEGIHR